MAYDQLFAFIISHFQLANIMCDNYSAHDTFIFDADTDDRKVALIDLMVKNYKFTWEDICRALECIDEANIARSIRQKFLS